MASTTKVFSLSVKPKLVDGDEDSATLQSNVEFTDSLRAFIKDNIIAGTAGTKTVTIDGNQIERYKVKSGILRRLPSNYGEILFAKELIDNGSMCLNTSQSVYDVASKLQSNLDKLLDLIGEYSMEVSVTFENN
jgi:hypothetical protein